MKAKPKTTAPAEPKKSFFKRYALALAVLALVMLIATAVLGTIFLMRGPAPTTTPTEIALENLPGPKYQLSKRSEQQLTELSQENPHVVGTFVIRYKYGKNESPVIYSWSKPQAKAGLDKLIKQINDRQAGPQGMSSEEARAAAMKDPERAAQQLRNSEEAKLGLIKCVSLEEAKAIDPILKTFSTGICYATIPPFEADASFAIIMLTDSKLENYSELAEMRRILLMLQIDIFNREFQGRETWAHP